MQFLCIKMHYLITTWVILMTHYTLILSFHFDLLQLHGYYLLMMYITKGIRTA
uniref:Uncharacterized protein n=1 Tax=Lepeophtheirus salmonis TaxID=72036 RepID=A0A0K2USQ4_LEPSM